MVSLLSTCICLVLWGISLLSHTNIMSGSHNTYSAPLYLVTKYSSSTGVLRGTKPLFLILSPSLSKGGGLRGRIPKNNRGSSKPQRAIYYVKNVPPVEHPNNDKSVVKRYCLSPFFVVKYSKWWLNFEESATSWPSIPTTTVYTAVSPGGMPPSTGSPTNRVRAWSG